MAVTISGPKQAHKKKKVGAGSKLFILLMVLAVAASGAFLFLGMTEWQDMKQMVLTWTELAAVAAEEDPDAPDEFVEMTGDGTVTAMSQQMSVLKETDYLYKPINLKALREINPEVSGYIYIPGSRVDYPILKEQEPEKYFYLNHNMYKEYDQYGSIFEICDEERGLPDLDNPITWLFGHHMNSGAMFATLYNYEKQDFQDTPIYVYRDDYRSEYQAIGYCYVDQHDRAYAFDAYGRGTQEYSDLLDYLKENDAMKREGRQWPDKNGDLLILSTCYGSAGTSRRMILLCVEQRRAMVPEYYEELQDVLQYGGDGTPIEKPDDGESLIPSMSDVMADPYDDNGED